MFNQVVLTGKVFNSELRFTSNGKAVVETNVSFKAGKGSDYSSVMVTFWEDAAKRIQKLTNGEEGEKSVMITIKGFMKQKKWKGKNDEKRSRVVVVANNFVVIDCDKTFVEIDKDNDAPAESSKKKSKNVKVKHDKKQRNDSTYNGSNTENESNELSDDDTLPF